MSSLYLQKEMERFVATILIAVAFVTFSSCFYTHEPDYKTQMAEMQSKFDKMVFQLEEQVVPEGWALHKNRMYSIAYSPEMEMRDVNSAYGQEIQKSGIEQPSVNTLIFQQKGLNTKETDAFKKYIRVLISPLEGEKDWFFNADEKYEYKDINKEDPDEVQAFNNIDDVIRETLWEIILQNCQRPDGTYFSIFEPKNKNDLFYEYKKACNGYAICTHYIRKREIGDGQVRGNVYFIYNNCEAVVVTAACPTDVYDKVNVEIFEPMVKSFKWVRVVK